jgi:protocatechuate 3,4-dioxygenase beta subunit
MDLVAHSAIYTDGRDRRLKEEIMITLKYPLVLSTFFLLASCGSAPADGQASCAPTEADSLGPFYVADTPIVDDLNRHGKSGDALSLSGRILSTSDQAPIAGARIEIWQTDGDGEYYPDDNGAYADYDDGEIDLRGTVISDEEGRYAVNTLVPGAYFPRPRHFHYRITADGYAPLVTQLYITGDGAISQPGGDCRHAPLTETSDGFSYEAPDIFLSAS